MRMNISITDALALTVSITLGFVICYYLTPKVINFSQKRGYVGIDIHKPTKPKIPTLGGISIIISLIIASIPLVILYPIEIGTLILTSLIGALVGLIDDLKNLRGITKMIITVIASIPIFIIGLLYPTHIRLGRPVVPILGRLRLTIVYWLFLPFAIAIPANAVNMLEVFNGIMPITCGLALVSLAISSLILGNKIGIFLTLMLLSVLLGYLPYNKYPARVFSGNIGSYCVGSAIGAIAVIAGLEFETIIVLTPHILNALLVILSIKGIRGRHEIKVRPIIVHEDGLLEANRERNAPLTLTRLILLVMGPLREYEVIKTITRLEIISCLLSIISTILKAWVV